MIHLLVILLFNFCLFFSRFKKFKLNIFISESEYIIRLYIKYFGYSKSKTHKKSLKGMGFGFATQNILHKIEKKNH